MATVEVFAIPDNKPQRLQQMMSQGRNIIQLGLKSKRLRRAIRPEDSSESEARLKKGRMYLEWLDTIEMTPEIKERTSMEKMLKYVFDDPTMYYPEDMKKGAQALYEKWQSENWGANAVMEEDVISADQEFADPVSEPAATPDEAPIVQSELPPPDHPIFGEDGIMHGIIIFRSPSGRKTYRLNPHVPKRSAKVFGHNGIPVGTWFANQLVALHRGAHGMRIGGIAGTTDVGAYSIVVSDIYEDLDDDRGETLYYSGSNSHNNDDPTRPAPSSTGTKALKASLQTGNPVRVLRSGGPHSRNRWLPECGLRYDGLYRVVALRERKNTKGEYPSTNQCLRCTTEVSATSLIISGCATCESYPTLLTSIQVDSTNNSCSKESPVKRRWGSCFFHRLQRNRNAT
ncbi:PUA-like domain-containing protein [Hypoxylon sp. NC0597]|nr:PUA-like domain-containing protein [Hypoxylon sp. NC0597]